MSFGCVRDVADDQLEACGKLLVTGNQIVIDDDFIATTLERMCGMAADVTCSTHYQNGQLHLFETRVFSQLNCSETEMSRRLGQV